MKKNNNIGVLMGFDGSSKLMGLSWLSYFLEPHPNMVITTKTLFLSMKINQPSQLWETSLVQKTCYMYHLLYKMSRTT